MAEKLAFILSGDTYCLRPEKLDALEQAGLLNCLAKLATAYEVHLVLACTLRSELLAAIGWLAMQTKWQTAGIAFDRIHPLKSSKELQQLLSELQPTHAVIHGPVSALRGVPHVYEVHIGDDEALVQLGNTVSRFVYKGVDFTAVTSFDQLLEKLT